MQKRVEGILKKLRIVEKDLGIVKSNSKDNLMKRLAVDTILRVKDIGTEVTELGDQIKEKGLE